MSHQALIAAHRLGLGARPGDLEPGTPLVADPRRWLHDQLAPGELPTELRALAPVTERVAALLASRSAGRQGRQKLRAAHREVHRQEAIARTLAGVNSARPFRERLVRFFSNLLTVSTSRVQCTGLVGAFEREAIRPHVTGTFSAMLHAAIRHPAMLVYLDNVRSTGPDAPLARRRDVGRNENLAREVLELHTVGVHGGYSQDDVIALADALTGWTLTGTPGAHDQGGGFAFAPSRHQPGAKTVLGTVYAQGGVDQGQAVLTDLAQHPATAQRICARLVHHFLGSEVPAVVAATAAAWRETGGELGAVAAALVDAPQTWQGRVAGLRWPDELLIAALRATAPLPLTVDASGGEAILSALAALGQTPWTARSPEGWSTSEADWLGGEALLRRLELAQQLGEQAAGWGRAPVETAEAVLGPALTRRARHALTRAPDRATGLALLFATPAFQRR